MILQIYIYLIIKIFLLKIKIEEMPQLVPFYFINQVTFAFILLIFMIYMISKYILPRFVRLYITRIFITKI